MIRLLARCAALLTLLALSGCTAFGDPPSLAASDASSSTSDADAFDADILQAEVIIDRVCVDEAEASCAYGYTLEPLFDLPGMDQIKGHDYSDGWLLLAYDDGESVWLSAERPDNPNFVPAPVFAQTIAAGAQRLGVERAGELVALHGPDAIEFFRHEPGGELSPLAVEVPQAEAGGALVVLDAVSLPGAGGAPPRLLFLLYDPALGTQNGHWMSFQLEPGVMGMSCINPDTVEAHGCLSKPFDKVFGDIDVAPSEGLPQMIESEVDDLRFIIVTGSPFRFLTPNPSTPEPNLFRNVENNLSSLPRQVLIVDKTLLLALGQETLSLFEGDVDKGTLTFESLGSESFASDGLREVASIGSLIFAHNYTELFSVGLTSDGFTLDLLEEGRITFLIETGDGESLLIIADDALLRLTLTDP